MTAVHPRMRRHSSQSARFDLSEKSGRLIKLDYSRIDLCERNVELGVLRAALQESRSGRAQCVLVEGMSGIGKSRLVSSFLSDVPDCFICKGKFDERSSQPFSAVVEALGELFGRVLPPKAVEEIRQACDVGSLQKFLPSLTKSSGWNSETHATISDFDRMKVAIRDVLRTVSAQHSLVLVLDDLHWADHGSLKIIETLVNDLSSTGKFMLIGLHRPVQDDHMLAQSILLTRRQAATKIRVSNLSVHGVSTLLASLLRREIDEVEQLAATMHHKTQGNPLFVGHFIRLLEQRQLIWFSLTSYKWKWDIDRIMSDTDISDNMIDILVSKIRDTAPRNRDALVRAACLGVSQIGGAILKCILAHQDGEEKDDVSLHDVVDPLVSEGLLEVLASDEYKFSHDKIRESAYMLLSNERERQSLHLCIGRRLNERRVALSDDEGLLLLAVRQLNLASDLIDNVYERSDLAKLNHRASEQALACLSFEAASEYLRKGLELLGDDPWKADEGLASKIFSSLSRTEYCCGRLDESLHMADEVLDHVSSLAEKQSVYQAKIRTLIQRGDGEEALRITCTGLKELGVPFPPAKLVKLEAIRTERRVWFLLRSLSDHQLCNLTPPRTPNDLMEWRAALTECLVEVVVHTHKAPDGSMDLALVRLMEITLVAGWLPRTPSSLIFWAWYLASKGRYDDALKFGKIALQYSAQAKGGYHDDRAVSLFHYFVYHWKLPYSNAVVPFAASIKKLWDSGSVEMVHLNTVCYFRLYFVAGLQLDELVKDIQKFADLLKDYTTSSTLRGNQTFFQMIWNLTGLDDSGTVLSGTFMDLQESKKKWIDTNNGKSLQKLYFSELVLATYFGDFELADSITCKLAPKDEMDGPNPLLVMRVFFVGLANAVLANTTRQRKYRLQRDATIRVIEKWVSRGNVNCHHMLLLLRAEQVVGKNIEQVQRAYDAAIAAAGRSGFLNNQALANERAGIYFLSKNDWTWAPTYLRRSVELYIEWGAAAKVKQLFANYGPLFAKLDTDSNTSFWVSGCYGLEHRKGTDISEAFKV